MGVVRLLLAPGKPAVVEHDGRSVPVDNAFEAYIVAERLAAEKGCELFVTSEGTSNARGPHDADVSMSNGAIKKRKWRASYRARNGKGYGS